VYPGRAPLGTKLFSQKLPLSLKLDLVFTPQMPLFLHLDSMSVDLAGNAGTENHASF